MSDIRFNQWLHQSGTGGVSQVASGAVGVGTTNPLADFYVRGDAQITGILTAGHIAMGSSITFGDDDRAYFGDGTDLQIYHSGSDSFISDTGTGDLLVTTSQMRIKNAANNATMAVFTEGGKAQLWYNNSQKFETTNTGAVVTGILTATGMVKPSGIQLNGGSITLLDRPDGNNHNLYFGTGGRAVIYHDGTNFSQVNNTGHFYLGVGVGNKDLMLYAQASGNVLLQQNTGVRYVKGVGSDASVQLFFNNNEKLKTTNTGVTITGTAVAGALDISGDIDVDGHTNLDNVSVAGVSTFTGDVFLSAGGANRIHMRHVGGGKATIKNPTAANLTFGTNNNDDEFVIENGGNIGIGTDNPTNKLSVCNGGIKVFGAATPNINFSPVHGNSGNGDISFDGNDLKIISNSSSAKVVIGAYSKLTHFVIKANGRIGMGTDNPSDSSLLHLYSTTFDPYLRIGSGTRDCGITLQPNSAFTAMRSDSANRLFLNAGGDSIRFSIGGTSDANEKLRILSNGNIGINETVPDTLLHITHPNAAQDVLKIEASPVTADTGTKSKIIFQITQSNNQSARLAEINSLAENGWGGGLAINVKPSNSTPENTTMEALRIISSDSAATNLKMVVDAYLQMGGYENTNESFANLAVLFSARDMAGSSLVSGQSDTISGYARRRETGDGNGTFFFGPYGAFPCGDYTALIRLKISDRSGSSVVGYIDIIGNGIETQGRNIAPITSARRIDVQTNDFTESDKYQYFALDFSKRNSGQHIEIRFLNYSSSTADIYLDHILVLPRINHGFEGGTGVFDY